MPERAEKRKRTSTIIILVAAFVLILCIGIVIGGGLVYGASRVAGIFDRDKPQGKVVVAVPRQETPDGPLAQLTAEGAVVVEVIPGSPAAGADLQAGDIIVAVNGNKLGPDNDLAELIGQYAPGDRITLQVERPGEETFETEVRLGEDSDEKGLAYLGVRYATVPALSMHLEGPYPFDMQEFDMPFLLPRGGSAGGVVIRTVIEGSPASEAGLQPGELIETIDGEQVESSEALTAAIAQRQPGSQVKLGIRNLQSGQEREVTVTLAAHPDEPANGYLGVTIGGAMHMEGFWPEGAAPDGLRFFFRSPNRQGAPLDPDQLPIDPEDMPFFRRRGLPLDRDDARQDQDGQSGDSAA
jgi:membrane-associated protease RseP (regulator of RpoE activity)